MTDVDPRKLYKYIMNTVIMDKKHDMKSAQVFSWVELELPPNGAGLRDERKINLLNGPPDGKSLLRCQFNRWHISQRGAESPRRSGRSHHSSIHDNIVVFGNDTKEHYTNLKHVWIVAMKRGLSYNLANLTSV